MNAASLIPSPVPSPCISVCVMGAETGLCEGCGRTIAEIAAWGTMPEEGKRAVWALIEQRRAAAQTLQASRATPTGTGANKGPA